MKRRRTTTNNELSGESQVSEFLILPDGRILVHNLTQPFAELLSGLNLEDKQFMSRVTCHLSPSHELSD
jgi:hypothetical protein